MIVEEGSRILGPEGEEGGEKLVVWVIRLWLQDVELVGSRGGDLVGKGGGLLEKRERMREGGCGGGWGGALRLGQNAPLCEQN